MQVCLCKKEWPSQERIVAAETLAYLTEVDTELQRLASISNHLIPTLAELLHYQPGEQNNNNLAQQETRIAQDMRQAAFRVSSYFFLVEVYKATAVDSLSFGFVSRRFGRHPELIHTQPLSAAISHL